MYNKGYTLVEMLFVLMICSICLLLLTLNNKQSLLSIQKSHIINILWQSKALAIANYDQILVSFSHNQLTNQTNTFTFRHGLVCESFSFHINAKGNVNQANTIHCMINEKKISIVSNLGSANFHAK